MKLLIIADDFTGALDTGVQFSKNNIPTTVFTDVAALDGTSYPSAPADCEVLVINAEFRHALPQAAFDATCRLLLAYAREDTSVYLKTDSALRGNISAVLFAALHIIKKPLCFVPAFPDLKRTTRNAAAYVNGILLEHSVFRNDPRTPTSDSYIPHIINNPYSQKCECIPVDKIKSLPAKNNYSSDTVYLFDCETNEQLDSIGDIAAQHQLFDLCAGCAGFASMLAKHLPFHTTASKAVRSPGPVLFVSGSVNAVTLRQLHYAKQQNYAFLSLYETMLSTSNDNTLLPKDKAFYKDFRFQNILKQAVSTLSSGRSVILATAADESGLFDLSQPGNLIKNEESLHNYIAEYTSCLVKSIVDSVKPAGMAVFGGDMAAAILKALGCHEAQAHGEITAGVPLCTIQINDTPLNLVTKSGGFGEDDIIPVIEQYLTQSDN